MKAHTQQIDTAKVSSFQQASTSKISQLMERGEGTNKSPTPRVKARAQDSLHASKADFPEADVAEFVPKDIDDSDEAAGDAGDDEDIQLEEGDAGGEDFPNHDGEQAWSQLEPKSESQAEEPQPDSASQLEAHRPLPRAPLALRSTPPSSRHHFSAHASGFLFPPSSIGTKRSLSDFVGDNNDGDGSPQPKRPRASNMEPLTGSPLPGRSSLKENKAPCSLVRDDSFSFYSVPPVLDAAV